MVSTKPFLAIINQSTVVSDTAVKIAMLALQQQVSWHFAPVWKVDASLGFMPKGVTPPTDAWWVVILDNSDQAGALGYHDLTPQGLPLAKVFAKTDAQYGLKWTITASHEITEMLADPFISEGVIYQPSTNNGYVFAREVGDPVENDALGYQINGVWVSDFVFPAWFQPGLPGPWDYMKHCTGPLQLTRGGYISFMHNNFQWHQATAQHAPGYAYDPRLADAHLFGRSEFPREYEQLGSRRERRARGKFAWKHSEVR